MAHLPDHTQDFVLLDSGLELLKFVTSFRTVLVHVRSQAVELSNTSLSQLLHERHGPGIGFASIQRKSLDTSSYLFGKIAGEQLRRLGLPSDRLLPGYYLVQQRELLGWHPCALPPQRREISWFVSGVFGLIRGLSSDDLLTGVLGAFQLHQQISSREAFLYFCELLDGAQQRADAKAWARRQKRLIRTKLPWARKLLGVREGASPREVKRAYRALVLATHPDRASNEEDRAMRTERMKELNIARELLEHADQTHTTQTDAHEHV